MKVCQHCGQVIADNANFCPRCGQSQSSFLMNQNAPSDDATEKICAWCKGRGTVPGFLGGEITCEVCNGKARNFFAVPPSLCLRCHGSGEEDEKSIFNERQRCKLCKGKGWIGGG